MKLPDSRVMVKLSLCQGCEGVVRASVTHLMNQFSKIEFNEEAKLHKLKIIEKPLMQYRIDKQKWCKY